MKPIIVFAITNDMLFAVANVIIGIERYSENKFNYLIFVEDKNLLNRQELYSLYNIIYKSHDDNECRVSIRNVYELQIEKFFQIDSPGIKNFCKKWTIMPLVKVLMYTLFDEKIINKFGFFEAPSAILWLDCDILIKRDIIGILNYGEICATLGSRARPLLKNDSYFPEINNSDIKPNGGCILLKKSIFNKIKNNEKLIIEIIDKLSNLNVLGIEEHLITILCKKLNIHLDIISDEYNYLPGYSRHTNPAIIHTLGKNKFWNSKIMNLIFPEWEYNNRIWLSSLLKSGIYPSELQKFNKSISTPGLINKIINEENWKNTWGKILYEIKFSHPLCYQQVNITSKYCQFYIKNCNIKHDCHYEILKNNDSFAVAIHFENMYQYNNRLLIDFLKSLSNNKYSFKISTDSISLETKVDFNKINEELTKLIDLSVENIIRYCK